MPQMPMPLRIDRSHIGPNPIDHRRDDILVIVANGKIIFRLALPRPVEGQNRHAAVEEIHLEGQKLFLRGIQPHGHQHERRPRAQFGFGAGATSRRDVCPHRGSARVPRRIEVRQRRD